MTLKEICEVGYACGDLTLLQAVLTAELHWDVFTTVNDFNEDFKKLYDELNEIAPDWDKKDIFIRDIFPDIKDEFPEFDRYIEKEDFPT